jgi:hypothetical protein
MSLEDWLRNGWIHRSETSLAEILSPFQVADREIGDARVSGLSTDGRFQHAYDAALQLCTVPLRACGYRVVKGQGHHKRSIDSLRYTLGSRFGETADHLERCSRLRGQVVYERIGVVKPEDAEELIQTVIHLRADVLCFLRTNHAKLIPPGF